MSAEQIATRTPSVGGYKIGGDMVLYILRREGVLPPTSHAQRGRDVGRQQQFIADFNRRWAKWENEKLDPFLNHVIRLWYTLEWLIEGLGDHGRH